MRMFERCGVNVRRERGKKCKEFSRLGEKGNIATWLQILNLAVCCSIQCLLMNFLEDRAPLEGLTVAKLVKNSELFIGARNSLSRLPEPTFRPFSEPDVSRKLSP
jgi:hypothetical protein